MNEIKILVIDADDSITGDASTEEMLTIRE
jgi:hypothetical protein